MRNFIVTGVLATALLAGFAGSSHAGFYLRVPFVSVQVDRGVFVGAGPARVHVPARSVVTAGPSGVVVSEPAPIVPADVPQAPPSLPAAKPLTVEQFAEAIKPLPGKYEVVLLHPKTGCPVKVCFELPDGCPRKVRWTRHVLEFDYGKCCVRIRFYHNGDVKVIS